jgi:hypothetical protein
VTDRAKWLIWPGQGDVCFPTRYENGTLRRARKG